MHFYTSSHRFRDINILRFWPSKSRSRSWSTIFAMTQFDGKCKNLGQGQRVQFSELYTIRWQNLQMYRTHFCTSSYCFRDINILHFWPSKSKHQGHGVQFFAITPFDGKCQTLQMSVFIFAKVRAVLMILTERETHRHRNGQAHGYRRNLADLSKRRPMAKIGSLKKYRS